MILHTFFLRKKTMYSVLNHYLDSHIKPLITHFVLTVQTSLLFSNDDPDVGFSLGVIGGGRVTTGLGGGKVAEGIEGLC